MIEPRTVDIPATLEEAKSRLGGLERLLTAKGWERAAIVYAFTRDDGRTGRPPKVARTSDFLNFGEFAALGISGLRSKDTVARYHRAWQEAVDSGAAEPVEPGQKIIVLPGLEWPPTRGGTDGYSSEEGARRTIERIVARHGVEPVVEALRARRVATSYEARGEDHPSRRRADATITDEGVIQHGQYVLAAYMAREDGTYEPGPKAALILTAIRPTLDWDADLAALKEADDASGR